MDTGSLGSFGDRVRTATRKIRIMGERDMFTTKLNVVASFALAALGVIIASIGPAFAGTPVPAPIVGAGLPVLAVLGGGYWLVKKLRRPR